jgi:phospho-N-acetylmuramoyl-pentapeptide-transferase
MTTYLAVICAVIAGFIISAAATGRLIPFLQKHQFKQFVREEGPQAHLSKTGTPSMGGLAITAASVLAALIIAAVSGVFSIRILVVCITMVLFGVIGFIDDYEKAIKKNNAGISPRQKIVLQFGFSLAFAIFAYFTSGTLTDGVAAGNAAHSSVWIPIWDHYLDIGILYIPWVMFVMIAFSNSVNLTDGLDGLASSVTALVAFLMVVVAHNGAFSDYPIFYAAIIGACLGFLVYNHNPAKIFMGDTGSMALGGGLAACAIMMKLEIILAVAGLIYVMEALSVIIQVTYFKKTGGKRIFRMAPLHHHFELGGMHETKVVRLFDTLTLIFCLIALLLSIL